MHKKKKTKQTSNWLLPVPSALIRYEPVSHSPLHFSTIYFFFKRKYIYIYISSYNTTTCQIWIFFSFITVCLMTIFFSHGTFFPAPSTTFCNWPQYLLLLINRVTDWPDTYVGKQWRAATFKYFLKQFRLKITICLVKNIEFYQLHSDANIYNQETYQSKLKNSNSQKLTTT